MSNIMWKVFEITKPFSIHLKKALQPVLRAQNDQKYKNNKDIVISLLI